MKGNLGLVEVFLQAVETSFHLPRISALKRVDLKCEVSFCKMMLFNFRSIPASGCFVHSLLGFVLGVRSPLA